MSGGRDPAITKWDHVITERLGTARARAGWGSAVTYRKTGLTITEAATVSERTLVLIKPDAVGRGLVGEVLSRFEAKGLTIEAMTLRTMDAALADEHYAEHVEKPFYPPLKAFMTSGPLVALILSGDQAIEVVRTLTGPTDGRKAPGGTIRGDFSLSNRENLVHASDSPESAKRELELWFPDA